MRIDILTLFPEMFEGPLSESIMKRAVEKGLVEIYFHNIRDYSEDKHKRVDDYPFGGGAGMVMRIEPIARLIEKLKEQHFEVIFMDVQMPEMDGFEATQFIRENEEKQGAFKAPHHIIVAMTANVMQGDAELCLATGMDDYIAKPISLDGIFEILNKYCSSHKILANSLKLDFKPPIPYRSWKFYKNNNTG